MSKNDQLELVHGSGNVFRDFGHADANIRQVKSLLAARIIGILDDRQISVRAAEKMTGFAAADFSRVRNAAFGRFTLDRMIRMLSALDDSVEITLDIRPRNTGNAFAPVPGAE